MYIRSRAIKIGLAVLAGAVLVFGVAFYLGGNLNRSKVGNTSEVSSSPSASASYAPTSAPTQGPQQQAGGTPPPSSRQITTGSTGGAFLRYTITVPGSWADDRSEAGVTTLTKSGYTLRISQQAAGAGSCQFPGDPAEGPMAAMVGAPVQTIANGLYKRGQNSPGTQMVCQVNTSGGKYRFPTGAGYITYSTPASPDAAMLGEMDGIVASIKT